MRSISYFNNRPEETAIIERGDRATVFIRTDIEEHEAVNPDGEQETQWVAVEYITDAPIGVEVNQEFVNRLIAYETEQAAKTVRAKRDNLLYESDKEVLPDRLTKTSAKYKAWAEYREALRDITEQEGFPFDVIWPERPQ